MENNNQPDNFLINLKKDFDKQFSFEDSEKVVEKETKQETLEKTAEKYSEKYFNRDEIEMRCSKISFIDGYKLALEQFKKK